MIPLDSGYLLTRRDIAILIATITLGLVGFGAVFTVREARTAAKYSVAAVDAAFENARCHNLGCATLRHATKLRTPGVLHELHPRRASADLGGQP